MSEGHSICSDIHTHDGTLLSSVTDEKVMSDILKCCITAPLRHGLKFPDNDDYVYVLILDHNARVDTKLQAWGGTPRDDSILQRFVVWDHPNAKDGKHHIMFVVINWGPDGKRQSRATGFIPK